MARLRSPNYPSVSLQEAIEMTRKIHSVERDYPVDRDVAVRHIGYSGITGRSGKVLASILQYGLLEKAAKNEVRVSDTAVDILHPDSPEEEGRALRRAAFSPSLFADLRARFPEGAPSAGNLRSYLVKQGFSDRAIGPAINAYLQTCEFVQQKLAFESYGDADMEASESSRYQRVEDEGTMRSPTPREFMPSAAPPSRIGVPILNQINVEIVGRHVRIKDVLLDKDGLEKLKRKIEALQTFIEDNDDGDADESQIDGPNVTE